MNVLHIDNLSSYCIAPIYVHKINKQQKNNKNCDLNLYHTYPVTNISFHANLSKVPTKLARYKGCILGGALGDALGAPVEFKTLTEIKNLYGKNGIQKLQPTYPTGLAEITDDTQMLIFTIDGLLRGLPKNFNPDKRINIDIRDIMAHIL